MAAEVQNWCTHSPANIRTELFLDGEVISVSDISVVNAHNSDFIKVSNISCPITQML